MVWRPRNGENPKNTPTAYAAAVRRGESWMWSRDSIHFRTRDGVT
jgi:hypothetical protein